MSECLGYDYSLQCCHFAVFAFLWLQTRPPLDLASLPSCHTALSCTSCSRQELTEMQHKQHTGNKQQPNGQFEQRFGRLAAQTVRADYRHYLWNSVYQKIKWENQSLSLILKRFSPRAYYQVLNGAENRRGKKKEIFNSKERNGI